jgi:hypothetical protein
MLYIVYLQIIIQKYNNLCHVEKTNDVWIVHDTIHLNRFFTHATYGHILGQNFQDAQDRT